MRLVLALSFAACLLTGCVAQQQAACCTSPAPGTVVVHSHARFFEGVSVSRY